jgi:hypothetical protein
MDEKKLTDQIDLPELQNKNEPNLKGLNAWRKVVKK